MFQTEKSLLPAWAAASRALLRRPSRGGLAGSPTCSAEVSANPVGLVFRQNLPFFFCQSQFRSAPVGLSLLQRLHTAFHRKKPPGRATRALGLKMFGLLHKPIIPAKPPPNQGWAGEHWCMCVSPVAKFHLYCQQVATKAASRTFASWERVYRRKNLDLLNHNYPAWISKDIWRKRCLSLDVAPGGETQTPSPERCLHSSAASCISKTEIKGIRFASVLPAWSESDPLVHTHTFICQHYVHILKHTHTSDGVETHFMDSLWGLFTSSTILF